MNSEGLLAVTDVGKRCVYLFSKDGALVGSIGKGVLGHGLLDGAAFDVKGNVWVTELDNHKVVKLSQSGRHQTIQRDSSERNCFNHPSGVSVSTEGLIYTCDCGNHRVTVHDEAGEFLFAFGSQGNGPGCFDEPCDVTFDSDGLVYVTDIGNKSICVWSKEGTFKRDFKTKYAPSYLAATSDNHLVITSYWSHTVMVYTLDGELVHEFGWKGSYPGMINGPCGICVDADGLVYVAEHFNNRVQIF